MSSSTPVPRRAERPAPAVPMSELLAACAAARAVSTPPRASAGNAGQAGQAGQASTVTRVPSGAKSQSV